MKSSQLIVVLAVMSWAVLASTNTDAPAAQAVQSVTRVPLEPVKYLFSVDEIVLSSRGRLLIRDGFNRAGLFSPELVAGRASVKHRYLVNMGSLDGSSVGDGQLHIDESCSINPFENFACDFSVPVDDQGRYSFAGSEFFGDFEFQARLLKPRIGGPEKFKVGLVDDSMFFGAATVAFEKNKISLERQGGEPRTITPFLETTFDQIDLTRFDEIDELELRLVIDVSGRASGLVKIRAGGEFEAFRLSTNAPWARLNPAGRYSAHIFVEDLAKPRIFSIYPETVTARQMHSTGGAFEIKVFGIGLGEDSEIELVREGSPVSAWARHADILMFNMGARARIRLPSVEPGSYTVRIHTSGLSYAVEHGFRVLP